MADLKTLTVQLKSSDTAKRQEAAEQLARLEEGAAAAALDLVKACADEDEGTRDWVVATLEGLGPPPEDLVGVLAKELSNPCMDSAYWAATLLGRLKSAAAPAVPNLAQALDAHDQAAVRQRAAWALGQIGPGAASARQALESAAGGQETRLASLAKEALGRL